MAHRGPAKIPGADDRPTGRQPGGFTRDPGLAYSSKQFGGQVGEALAVEGGKGFTLAQKFAKADRAAAVSSAKADYDARIIQFENGLEQRSDHKNFVNDHTGALGTVASQISSGLSGEVKAAFDVYVRSQTPLSMARVRATSRKLMVSEAKAKSFNAGVASVGKALNVATEGERNDIRDSRFEDLDSLADANILTDLEVAQDKLKYTDNVAKGRFSKIILANPFDPRAETAIKNLRPALQPAAQKQLQIARSSRVAKDNRDIARRETEERNAIKFNRVEKRRALYVGLEKFDQNNNESRIKGLAWAESFEREAIINAREWGLDAKTLDWIKSEINDFREGKISPPGGLNEALAGITNEMVTSMDHPLVKVLSNKHKSLVQARFDRLMAEGQQHFTKQDAWKAGNDDIEALILSANPLVIAGADNAVLRNQIANKIKLAQSLYRARAYDSNDRGEMLRDLSRQQEGKYSVFNEVRDIVALAATPSSAEAQIRTLIEEKNVILQEIREKYGRVLELLGAELEAQKISEEEGQMIISPHFAKRLEIDPVLKSRITHLDNRITILNSLGTSPDVPAGLQSVTKVP